MTTEQDLIFFTKVFTRINDTADLCAS